MDGVLNHAARGRTLGLSRCFAARRTHLKSSRCSRYSCRQQCLFMPYQHFGWLTFAHFAVSFAHRRTHKLISTSTRTLLRSPTLRALFFRGLMLKCFHWFWPHAYLTANCWRFVEPAAAIHDRPPFISSVAIAPFPLNPSAATSHPLPPYACASFYPQS